jgi:K+ potassium transporter
VLTLAGERPDPACYTRDVFARHLDFDPRRKIKYVSFAMRIDNHGEGGILALMALIGMPPGSVSPYKR